MMRVLPVKPHDEPPLLLTTLVLLLGLINQMNVAAITIDGTFTTRCSQFLHAKQESEIMMILTSVLANLGPSCVESLYLVARYCPAH